MFLSDAKEIYKRVKNLENDPKKNGKRMPSECYYLDEDTILCYKREVGDGRFPYSEDGLTLWAYSSGNMSLGESNFNVFLESTEGREPYLSFFFGKEKDGGFIPASVTGTAKNVFEGNVNRFTVYTSSCVYYFAETDGLLAVLRAFVDGKKRVHFSLLLENESGKKINTYLSSYFNPLLRHQCYDDFEDKWYKVSDRTENGFKFRVTEHISRDNCFTHFLMLNADGDENGEYTTSRRVFCGGTSNSLSSATSLYSGAFKEEKLHTD